MIQEKKEKSDAINESRKTNAKMYKALTQKVAWVLKGGFKASVCSNGGHCEPRDCAEGLQEVL